MRSLEPAVFPIGPDLLFDRSVRDSHATVEDPTGEVLFSPKFGGDVQPDSAPRKLAGADQQVAGGRNLAGLIGNMM